MAKRAKLSMRAEKGDRDLSETRNTEKHKQGKKTKKQPNKCFQNKLSQTVNSTKMAGSQRINTKENKNGCQGLRNDDPNEEGARLVTSTKNEELLNNQSKDKEAKEASSTVLYSRQDSHSDGLQIIATQPQNNQINGSSPTDTTDPLYPCSEISGTSVVHTLHTSHTQPVVEVSNPDILNGSRTAENIPDGDNPSTIHSMTPMPSVPTLIQEYLPSAESPKRKIRLILPERTSSRSQTPLDKKIR